MTLSVPVPRYATVVAVVVFACCSLLALLNPLITYDSWWYHLPFSSRLWNIGGGAAAFHLDPTLTARWLGFPVAWEWVEGLVWRVTGSLRATIIPQFALCLVFFAYASRHFRLPLAWVVLGFFASPMLFLHFQTIYLDLPAALCTTLGFLLLFDLLEDARRPGVALDWRKVVAVVASLGLAGNIKYQALLGGLAVSAIAAVGYVAVGGIATRRRAALLGVLVAANLVAASSAISNFVHYSNPFYPIAVKVSGKTVFEGPELPEWNANFPSYQAAGPRLYSLPGPVNFLLSATEADWALRGVVPWYSLDSDAGDMAVRGPPSRTGGWGSLFFVLNACLLALQLMRLRVESDRGQRALVIAAVALVVATACMPRAHELRYWLYLPIVMLVVNLRFLQLHFADRLTSAALVFVLGFGFLHTVVSPGAGLLKRHEWSPEAMRAAMPSQALQTLRETGRFCDPTSKTIFRYSTAVTGIPGVVSLVESDCAGAGR